LRGIESAERLFQVTAPGLDADFPPVRSIDTLPNNLPRQLASFIGREAEIIAAEERLAGTSLLTLTGAGGVGKTRLALEIGAHLASSFPNGVWLVELAALTDAELVDDAVAAAISVKQRAGTEILSALVEDIATRRMLLILDNCEHLIGGVVTMTDELLRRCPNIKVLATSREALGIPGEALLPVPSMSLPVAEGDADAATMADSDAVRLFVDRAAAVLPGFALGPANAEAIAQICRRLDGIPLAVELAAARVRSLPPNQIAARLDDRFRLLTGGSRTALPRHRTLRAAMDWSFDLLGEPEQALLRRLSVFAGSFSLEAAEAVTTGGVVEKADVLDLLGRLIDRSLLVAEEGDREARFRMLETIRDYAQERLAETGDAGAQYGRHRDWFVTLVDRARPAFFSGPVQPEWVGRLAADHDNLRAALRWAHEDPDGADAELSMASGLWRFWEVRGDLEEGSAWLERALRRLGGEVSIRRASALTGAGSLAAHRGDYARAASFHEASLMLHRELGNPLAIATACNNLASVAIERSDLERARELYSEAIDLTRDGGDQLGAAFTLINLADLTSRMGDALEADRLFRESINLFEKLGDRFGVAHASTRLAQTARRRGDLDTARTHFEEALTIHRSAADRHGEARVLAHLADVTADGGDPAGAETLYHRSLAIRLEQGDRIGMATVIERLAGVAEDRPARAAALLGGATAIRDAIGAPRSAVAESRVDQFLAGLHRAIGAEAVQAAVAAGRSAPLAATLRRAAGSD
jgi:non-specific serine/threonine protein kinase